MTMAITGRPPVLGTAKANCCHVDLPLGGAAGGRGSGETTGSETTGGETTGGATTGGATTGGGKAGAGANFGGAVALSVVLATTFGDDAGSSASKTVAMTPTHRPPT